MSTTTKNTTKCVLCSGAVEEEGQDACISCRQSAGEQVDIPDEADALLTCNGCGKEAIALIGGFCDVCLDRKPVADVKPVDTKPNRTSKVTTALEEIGVKLLKPGALKKSDRLAMAADLQDLIVELHTIRKDTIEWATNLVKKNGSKPVVKAATKVSEAEVKGEPCAKCGGTGIYTWQDNGTGKPKSGTCYDCKGKKYMSAKDVKRDSYYHDRKAAQAMHSDLRKVATAEDSVATGLPQLTKEDLVAMLQKFIAGTK